MAINIIKASDLSKKQTLNVMVYGAPGVGKTTFCGSSPKPLIIDMEKGSISLSDRDDVDIVQVTDIDQIKEAVSHALNNGYKTICFDSLTRYCELLMIQILKEEKQLKARIQDWGTLVTRIKEMVWALQARDINTIFICLEREVEEDGKVMKRPAISGQLVNAIPAILDVQAYLYVQPDGKRKLGLNPTDRYHAKHRTPLKNKIVEDLEPDFNLLQSKIYSKGVEKTEKKEGPKVEA